MTRLRLRSWALAGLFSAGLAGCGDGSNVSPNGGGTDPATGLPIGGSSTGTSSTGGTSGSGKGNSGSGGSGGGFVFRAPDAGAGSGAPSGGGSGPAPTADKNCGLKKYGLQRLPAELLLVLDRSGSMVDQVDAGNPRVRPVGPRKWPEVVAALDATLMKTETSVGWGLKLFPNDNACGVTPQADVPIAAMNRAAIMSVINAHPPVQNGGATPTQTAVRAGTQQLMMRATPNPKYLLLATDGLPNCANGRSNVMDQMGAIGAVAAAAAAGIPTFVVGIATTTGDAHATLNQMAVAGTRPRMDATQYYPVASRDELANVLTSITGQIASCTFNLETAPPNPDNVAVDVDTTRIAPDKANGWAYGPANKSIVFNGTICEKLKSGAAKDVQIIFGCPGMLIP